MNPRNLLPFVAMAGIFLAVELLTLSLVPLFDAAGLQATENPGDPVNSVVYIVFILVFTLVILVAIRYGFDWILQALILLSASALVYYVLAVFMPSPLAVALALGVAVLLYVYPEWYVINTAGVLMGAGGAGIFGISFGILPSLLLLVVLAVYDAIAVYRTKHMLTLAEGVMDLHLPVMFVVPKRLDYSFIDQGAASEGEERDAFFMGLGDAVIPSVLIASSAHFIDVPLASNYAVFGGVIGSLVGFSALMYQVSRGNPQAGLPLLNGGTIAGFLVGVVALGLPLGRVLGL